MSEQKVSRGGELIKVPFEMLRLDPNNERLDYGELTELTNSIRENGILEPLFGYKSREDGQEVYFVVNGSRRFHALKALADEGNTDIFAPMRTYDPTKVAKEQLVVQRLLRNEGKPFTPIEKAQSVGKLIAYGWEEKQIATRLGMSVAWVNDMMLLYNAPEKLKAIVVNKTISATLAVQQIKAGLAEALVEDVETGKFEEKKSEDELPFVGAPSEDKKASPKRAKITKSSLDGNTLNSLKELKAFRKLVENAPETDPIEMPECKLMCWEFFLKVLDNKVTGKQISNFFQKD